MSGPPHVGVPRQFLGMPTFQTAAREALQDAVLRRNLAHATGTIRAKRARVVAELDNWEQLRLAAEAIKDAALHRLDEHLVEFEAKATAALRAFMASDRVLALPVVEPVPVEPVPANR